MVDKLKKINEDELEVTDTVTTTVNRADLLLEREVLVSNLIRVQEHIEEIDQKLAVLNAK